MISEDQAFVWDADIKCVIQRVGMLEETCRNQRSFQANSASFQDKAECAGFELDGLRSMGAQQSLEVAHGRFPGRVLPDAPISFKRKSLLGCIVGSGLEKTCRRASARFQGVPAEKSEQHLRGRVLQFCFILPGVHALHGKSPGCHLASKRHVVTSEQN